MSDDQNDDAPDIPPALTAEQWADGAYSSPAVSVSRTRVGIAGNGRVHIDVKQHPLDDVSDFAALIAFVNEAMERSDDPRAITRETIRLLRTAAAQLDEHCPSLDQPLPAGFVDTDDLIAHNNRLGLTYTLLNELADALESYLPPEAKS